MSLDNTKFIVDGIPKNRTAFARYLQGQVLSWASQALYNRYFNPDNAFYLCPFQVIAGAMFATKQGRRGMNVLISDFPQLEMVIKGQDTFTIC